MEQIDLIELGENNQELESQRVELLKRLAQACMWVGKIYQPIDISPWWKIFNRKYQCPTCVNRFSLLLHVSECIEGHVYTHYTCDECGYKYATTTTRNIELDI